MYVSRYEVDYQGSTIPYTARTIEYFRHCCNEKEVAIYFIAGLDIIYHLSRWKDFDKLKTMCEFIFVRRNVNDSEQINDKLVYLKQSGLHYTLYYWKMGKSPYFINGGAKRYTQSWRSKLSYTVSGRAIHTKT